MIKPVFPSLVVQEKFYIYKHFDSIMKGYITSDEFAENISSLVQDESHKCVITVEDVFKPIAYKRASLSLDSILNDKVQISAQFLQELLVKQNYSHHL